MYLMTDLFILLLQKWSSLQSTIYQVQFLDRAEKIKQLIEQNNRVCILKWKIAKCLLLLSMLVRTKNNVITLIGRDFHFHAFIKRCGVKR